MTAAGIGLLIMIGAGCIWIGDGCPGLSMAIIPASGIDTADISVSIMMMSTGTGTTATMKDIPETDATPARTIAARKDILETDATPARTIAAMMDIPKGATSGDNPEAVSRKEDPGIVSSVVSRDQNPGEVLRRDNNDKEQHHGR
jgi:hypothetical protein